MPVNLIDDKGLEKLPIYELSDAKGHVLNVQVAHQPVYRDNLTGQLLDPELVNAARAKELEYFNAKVVWERRAMGEAHRVTGNLPIRLRLVDVNKADGANPNVRS